MEKFVFIKTDPYDHKHYQVNIALNLISRINLRHRRVEHRIYNYSRNHFRIAPPMYGCFLSECKCSNITCDKCPYHYIKELL